MESSCIIILVAAVPTAKPLAPLVGADEDLHACISGFLFTLSGPGMTPGCSVAAREPFGVSKAGLGRATDFFAVKRCLVVRMAWQS